MRKPKRCRTLTADTAAEPDADTSRKRSTAAPTQPARGGSAASRRLPPKPKHQSPSCCGGRVVSSSVRAIVTKTAGTIARATARRARSDAPADAAGGQPAQPGERPAYQGRRDQRDGAGKPRFDRSKFKPKPQAEGEQRREGKPQGERPTAKAGPTGRAAGRTAKAARKAASRPSRPSRARSARCASIRTRPSPSSPHCATS